MNTVQVQLSELEHHILTRQILPKIRELMGDSGESSPALNAVTSILDASTKTASYLWTNGSGRIELEIQCEHIDAVAQSGNNEPPTRAVINDDPFLAHQLRSISVDALARELTESGMLFSDILEKSRDDMEMHLLWQACWDLFDNRPEIG
ncbi:hypothetical protein [Vreelandella jeotgali]|uniref:hypothetical protein n=1 Tax=Vreelandella jeotgali TaxID=553386 RepID=UPI000349471E|nr:hypothetical protein [Halomonas jeotgali]